MGKKIEMENIRVDWAPVLESQVAELEENFPGRGVRDIFQGIIEDLNENRIKSRLILSGKDPAGYAYYRHSRSMSDRILGNAGFVDEKYSTPERCRTLIGWLAEEGRSQDKIIMLNDVFNGAAAGREVLEEMGFGRLEREMMEISLREFREGAAQLPEGYTLTGIEGMNVDDYLSAEISAYKGSEDELLFSTKEGEMEETARSIFEGSYGNLVTGVSRIAKHNGNIAGACLVVSGQGSDAPGYPLIIDVFVSSGHRGKGLAKALLQEVLTRAKVAGYMNMYLWVNVKSNARHVYENIGFRSSDLEHEVIYYLGFK